MCEELLDNEAIYVHGVERYSNYKGYSNSCKFDGNFIDTNPIINNRRDNVFVSIDA
jgi:hypothetical protein